MVLQNSVDREELHLRRIELRGFGRVDGLYDIEAHLVDSKTEDLPVHQGRMILRGAPIHEMWVRLVIDEALKVVDALAVTDAAPYGVCRDATATLQCLRGLHIGRGWSLAVRERLAGKKGCTHLTELLKPLATVAFLSLWALRRHRPASQDTNGRPAKIDSCYAYASERELVRQRWPIRYTGTDMATGMEGHESGDPQNDI